MFIHFNVAKYESGGSMKQHTLDFDILQAFKVVNYKVCPLEVMGTLRAIFHVFINTST